MTTRRMLALIAIVMAVLMVPFVGMQFSTQVAWTLRDFVMAGLLLFGAGMVYELSRTILLHTRQRVIAGIIVGVGVCVGWVELAVGLFGSPFAGS